MEETINQEPNKPTKRNIWYLIVPIAIAVIAGGILFYLDYKKNPAPANPGNTPIAEYRPQPVSPENNPARAQKLPTDLSGYGCAGMKQLETQTLKQPDAVWEIKKDGSTTTISLGKYRINAPKNTIFDINKFWIYFFSEKLGRKEDGLYGLESSYVSKIRLVVNDFASEVKLGGDSYMFLELNYPLGDLYPYDKAVILDYEILIDLKCKNIKNGACLDNAGKPLDYINGASVIPLLRIFASGCQDFTKDFEIPANFKY
jgi:hypothetical protein